MKTLLTPKQVAQAIGASESSLKRWCDKGLMTTVRTPGGHRRLAVSDVLAFLRKTQHSLVRPELLGLPSSTGEGTRTIARAAEKFESALLAGDEAQARRIAFDLYLAGRPAWEICDEVIARAMNAIGDRWECGEAHVYEEHRACEICIRLLGELRAALPSASDAAPRAIGGSWENDPYRLPTTMVEIVLREAGWNAASYGASLPPDTFRAALEKSRPRILWLSVSSVQSPKLFLQQYDELFTFATSMGTAVAVGGQALDDFLRRQMRFSAYCDNLKHLISFAATLWTPGNAVSAR